MKELQEIQEAIKVPKSQKNEVVGFMYRTAERILSLVRPLCAARGCSITLSDDIQPLPNGTVYIRATVTLTNSQGESVSTTAFAQQGTLHKGIDYPQLTGAASSYARKYALCGLFAIDDSSNDPDTEKNTQARMEAQQAEAKEMADNAAKLNTAKAEAVQSRNRDELMAVWGKYPELQHEQSFLGIMNQQKKTLGL